MISSTNRHKSLIFILIYWQITTIAAFELQSIAFCTQYTS
jgi:hypothetical protein